MWVCPGAGAAAAAASAHITLPPPPPGRPQGKRCLVSGAGNVAQHCAAKLVDQGAVVLTLSDSKGCIYKPGGLSREDVEKARLSESGLAVLCAG